MIIYVDIETSGDVNTTKLLSTIRDVLVPIIGKDGLENVTGLVVKTELLSANPYIPPR